MKKQRAYLAALLAAGLTLPTVPSLAQRDAGAKIRGDVGRYSGRAAQSTQQPGYQPRPSYVAPPAYSTQPAPQIVQSPRAPEPYEAYSIEPLPFSVGDQVTVVGPSSRLMRGNRTLGTVPAGAQLRVLQLRGPWVGVATEVDGQQVGGWLWYSQVAAGQQPRT